MMNSFFRKLGWLAKRHRKEHELREELEFHLAEEAEERRAMGLTEDQARFAARRELGNITRVVEDTRAAWGWIMLEQVGQDLRYAVRTLIRTPTVTFTALLVLALGLGATAAIFTVANGVLLRPLPFPAPDRLVQLGTVGILEFQADALGPERAVRIVNLAHAAVRVRERYDSEEPEAARMISDEISPVFVDSARALRCCLCIAEPDTWCCQGKNRRRDALLVHRGEGLLRSPIRISGMHPAASRRCNSLSIL